MFDFLNITPLFVALSIWVIQLTLYNKIQLFCLAWNQKTNTQIKQEYAN